jgi:hypothetical protein
MRRRSGAARVRVIVQRALASAARGRSARGVLEGHGVPRAWAWARGACLRAEQALDIGGRKSLI